MATPRQVVHLTAEQYELRLKELSGWIKMMVNAGMWVGDQKDVAIDIRQRINGIRRDARTATTTIAALTSQIELG
jgi:hypothetical protein